MRNPNCLVIRQSQVVLQDAHRLAVSMRRLRRLVRRCQRCDSRADCAFIEYFNSQLDAALQEVMEMWNLGKSR